MLILCIEDTPRCETAPGCPARQHQRCSQSSPSRDAPGKARLLIKPPRAQPRQPLPPSAARGLSSIPCPSEGPAARRGARTPGTQRVPRPPTKRLPLPPTLLPRDEGTEREESPSCPQHAGQRPHLLSRWFLFPPTPFFYYFITSHSGEEFLLYNYQPVPACGTKPGRSDESFSAGKKGALQSFSRS